MNEVKIENVTPPNELKTGTYWQHDDGEVYLLATVGVREFVLVCLEDGNRFSEPKSSIDQVFNTSRTLFTQITTGRIIIITPKP